MKKDGVSRGFGFVTFVTEQGMENACAFTSHFLKGKEIECYPARMREGDPATGAPLMMRPPLSGTSDPTCSADSDKIIKIATFLQNFGD